MKRMRMLAACSLLLTAFPALAQPEEAPMIGMMGAEVMGSGPMGNGMMGPGMMMGMGPSMMMGQGDLKAMVEGRLAYVKTALGLPRMRPRRGRLMRTRRGPMCRACRFRIER